jgi:hypothetical protein
MLSLINLIGQTPVQKAVRRGHKGLVMMLLENNPDIVLQEIIALFPCLDQDFPAAKFQELLNHISKMDIYKSPLLKVKTSSSN